MKICCTCKQEQELCNFYKNKNNYYNGSCKKCFSKKYNSPEDADRKAQARKEFSQTPLGKYKNLKKTSRINGRSFDGLSFEKFNEILELKCKYCGGERPKGTVGLNDTSGNFTDDNVIPVCRSCNTRKMSMSSEKFLYRTRRLYGKTPEHIEKEESVLGNQYGKLTILSISSRKSSAGRLYYLCRCECGIEKDVRIDAILSGCTKSCGCSKGGYARKKKNLNMVNTILPKADKEHYEVIFQKLVHSSNARKIKLDITKEYYKPFYDLDCFYCNKENTTKGIDRIDSSKGYEVGNIVSCCKICNSMKNTLSYDEFIGHIKSILGNI